MGYVVKRLIVNEDLAPGVGGGGLPFDIYIQNQLLDTTPITLDLTRNDGYASRIQYMWRSAGLKRANLCFSYGTTDNLALVRISVESGRGTLFSVNVNNSGTYCHGFTDFTGISDGDYYYGAARVEVTGTGTATINFMFLELQYGV